ncbi:MAG: rhomboid family intramembrane serine protease [Bacteroidetes bacterium]|nr:rhomboid family intramembrane serine protease [Bacteroidota bacterium]
MMNYSNNPQPNPFDELKKFFIKGSGLSVLILINISVWVLIQALKVIFFFFNNPGDDSIDNLILHALAIPASVPDLAMKPWTLVTYNFLHIDIWHILFNMLWLYWFGKIFLEFLTARKLVFVYLFGGITGGLVYVFAFNVFPVFADIVPSSFALGASASVMAIVTAISFYVPGYTIQLFLIGKLRIGYLAIILFVFDFFMIPSGNAGGHLAHIGGALFGVIYIWFYKISQKAYKHAGSGSIFDKIENLFKIRKRRTYSSANFAARPKSDDEYNKQKKESQRRIDEILDKISKGGYDSLTREEKEFLFTTSNKR